MKYISQDSMENYMTPEALELLATGLKSFMEQKTFIDDVVFDEISKEARFLSNRKLAEKNKMARRRYGETKNILKAKYSQLDKRRLEPPDGDSACSSTSNDSKDSCTRPCSLDIHLHTSQSAPSTPALALRCNNNSDLKRRSQSLEDEIADEDLQYLEGMSDQLETVDIRIPTIPETPTKNILGTSPTSNIPTEISPESLEESDLPDSGSDSLKSTSPESTDFQLDGPKLEDDEYGTTSSNSSASLAVVDASSSSDESDNGDSLEIDTNSTAHYSAKNVYQSRIKQTDIDVDCMIVDTLSSTPSDSSDACYSVYRGDKFMESNDITIPLEEGMSYLNNNSLIIQSPTIESGHVVYAPIDKPVPAQRFTIKTLPLGGTPMEVENEGIPKLSSADEESQRGSVSSFTSVQSPTSPLLAVSSFDTSNMLALDSTFTELPSQCRLSPILSLKQKQKAMQKRKSFHGFSSYIKAPILNFARSFKSSESSGKRSSLAGDSINEEISVSNIDGEEFTVGHQLSQLDQIECTLKEKDASRLLQLKRTDKTASLVTASSESLPSLPEDDVIDAANALPRSADHVSSSKAWSPIPVNSHLMNRRVLPTHRSTSMADLRLTETEVKRRITLAHIIDELVQTEKDYVAALRLVVDSYIPELNREDVPQTLRGKRAVIFGNIEKIYEFHNRYFLNDLVKCEDEPFKISQCFLRHESEFLLYALYNKNKPKSDDLMSEHGSIFFREQQLLMRDKMDLSSYLLKPVQRMGKYALMLKQVLKACPESSPEYDDLVAAEEMIRFCLQHGNDLLAMDALEECDVNLQEQGTLLLQNEFTVWKGKKKAFRHVFLFEHLIVLSKTRRAGAGHDQYVYKTSLKTADIGLTENIGTSGVKFEIWFRKRTGESWTFQANSSQTKNRWVNVIEKLLWTQALKNRETRLSELSTMGVGHKPSLDLKKSDDNINDRFIPSLSKGNLIGDRRSADNLAEDSIDFTKKRPYSVISLAASSSSSNSSASSTGPGMSRRSLTWLDLKAAFTGKGLDNSRSFRLRKGYKSETKLNRCDSGISSSSDIGGPISGSVRRSSQILPKTKLNSILGRKYSESEI